MCSSSRDIFVSESMTFSWSTPLTVFIISYNSSFNLLVPRNVLFLQSFLWEKSQKKILPQDLNNNHDIGDFRFFVFLL